LESSETAQFTIATNDLELSLGAEDDGGRGLRGGMDDARIYNRALSNAEIMSLYTNP
jgi:hypothetical protein